MRVAEKLDWKGLSHISVMFQYNCAICREKKTQQGQIINNFKNASILFLLKMGHFYRNMSEIRP
jgi:hypothetical protein